MMITELRRYRLRPEMVESWLGFFRDTLAQSERHGIRVEYAGLEAGTSTFIWLRSFVDEADRERRKGAFYGDAWWTEREAFAMGHVLEYEVTFLDAAIVREGGELVSQRYPAHGEPAGSRPDTPPDGWSPSTRRTFVPDLASPGVQVGVPTSSPSTPRTRSSDLQPSSGQTRP